MNRTLGELRAMVLKAARGVGVPVGHGEDLAEAAVTLAIGNPEALSELIQALAEPFEPGSARVAIEGPLLIDRMLMGADSERIEGLDAPSLFLAMVDDANTRRAGSLRTEIVGNTIVVSRDKTAPDPPATRIGPVEIAPDLWDFLGALAARTYVPASEASRTGGAGAGLIDND